MKSTISNQSFFRRTSLAALGLVAGILMLLPGQSQASTSGNAKIFNEATVTYTTTTTGGSKTNYGNVTITVATKAAAPYVTVTPTVQTTAEGATISYTYSIINQSNGINDLSASAVSTVNFQVGAPTTDTLATSAFPAMWGGISKSIPANNTINFPANSLTGVTAGTTTVAVKNGTNVYYYTVATVNNGTIPSHGVTEADAVMTVTPIAPSPALTAALAGSGGVGVVVGEFKTSAHTQVTGTLTAFPLDGTHTSNITVTATDATAATASYTTKTADGNETVTTVKRNTLTVSKNADKLTPKPGDTVTYTITVSNTGTTATVTASVADPLPSYTTYVANSTRLNGKTVTGDGASTPLAAGLSIDDDNPVRTAGTAATGVIHGGSSATITYQVTVN